ncbi:3-hydroxyacyl-CoA dehydrogenase [Microterricola viridarii]|nr:3-hydroxyacyl-CoA dehydrogenase [Microterricola viridarii]
MIVGVVGAGAMGRGIAQVSAAAGHDVVLFDSNADAVTSGLDAISASLGRAAERGRITADAAAATVARISGVDAIERLAGAELVIEAIVERLDVKRSVFAQLEAVVGPDTILASNTSSLSIASIASAVQRRTRLIGLHFFNPVPAMALVEVVGTPYSADAVLERAKAWVAGIGKTAVVVRDSPGFLVNLAGRAYATEALAILQDGIASVEQIDRIATANLGFPLGPFELMDLTGLDINYTVTANLYEHNFGDPRLRSTWYHRYLFDAGLLGRKTGRGFHDYAGPDATAEQPAPTAVSSVRAIGVALAGDNREALSSLCARAGIPVVAANEADLVLIAPWGSDASASAARLGLDPLRTVALDLLVAEPSVHTVMVPPGVDAEAVHALAERLRGIGGVEVIRDSPGFIAQRLLAAIVNLAADVAQRGIASPGDIDTAVTLGLRYPHGPLEWADRVGLHTITAILAGMHETTADQRYTTSAWLRRRANAGLSALTPDFS